MCFVLRVEFRVRVFRARCCLGGLLLCVCYLRVVCVCLCVCFVRVVCLLLRDCLF